jgi:hypothetical protein
MSKEVDKNAMRELDLFIMNTRKIYINYYEPLQNQIIKYLKNGKFDEEKALQGLYRVCNNSASLYCTWYGGDVRSCFPAELKRELSKIFLENIIDKYNTYYAGFAEVVESSKAEPVSKGA